MVQVNYSFPVNLWQSFIIIVYSLLSIDTKFAFIFAKIKKNTAHHQNPKKLLEVSESNCTYQHNFWAQRLFHAKKCPAEYPETLARKKLKLYFPANDMIWQRFKNVILCLFQELLLDNHQKEAEKRVERSRFECPHCKTLNGKAFIIIILWNSSYSLRILYKV